MANTITQQVQEDMGLDMVHKADPNTQDAPFKEDATPDSALAQAAIPAVLAAIYKKTKTEEGSAELLAVTDPNEYLPILYGDTHDAAVEKVAAYSNTNNADAAATMRAAAVAAIKVLNQQVANVTPATASSFFTSRRNEILSYLPAPLHMGNMLDDTAIDDHTNKMHGPISSLMHSIETIFSGTK